VKQILIVIPTYNEAANVKPLVKAIEAAFRDQIDYKADILFVDDNSPDGTAKVIQSLQRKHQNIHLLTGPKQGLGKAYIRGLTCDLKLNSYFAIVTMDADLSHDPKDIPRLLSEIDKGADYVIGSRYVTGGHTDVGYSWLRRLQSRTANIVARSFIDLKIDVKDLTGGFKAMRASKLKTVPIEHINASGYVFQVSLLYEFAKRKYAIQEIPITFHSRQHGKSKLGLKDSVEFLRLTFRLNPHARLPRMIRFACVGASGTLVNLVILTSLVKLAHLNVDVSYLIALEGSIMSNFVLNHWFTFSFVRHTGTESLMTTLNKLSRYNLVSIGGIAISLTVFALIYHVAGLNYILADLIGIIAAMSWNYWLSNRLVWKIVDNDPTTEPSSNDATD